MHNSELYGVPKACHNNLDIQQGNISSSTSKYVYVKQSLLTPNFGESSSVISKVLVNPQFNKTVFVNPNFNKNAVPPTITVPKIHINPRIQNIKVNMKDCTSVQKIHVNPNILRNIPVTSNNLKLENVRGARTNCGPMRNSNSSIYSTKAQPSDTSIKSTVVESKLKKRRSSVRSKFKIIRSCVFENSLKRKDDKRRTSIQSKCRIITSKSSSQNYSQIMSCKNRKSMVNKFKLDNRNIRKASALPYRNKKYVYVNRFLSISDIARNNLFKHNGANKKSTLINISGILYKKSPNSLKRTANSYKKSNDVKKVGENMVSKSKFTFIKKSLNKKATEETRTPKHSKPLRTNENKKPSPRKLRKCNIPCPYYRKFGRCKGKENGKCYRKHDPDQIALCTKFLQGACVDKKCLLSHNVSPEKMPICKFYLEGTCSREDCPYLHVRISPKADICKDFLEGFCKKASQCDKRHQFLCPDYEKAGSCLKQRCPYPHGKMVRKYSVFNKNKFAKKSSDGCKKETENSDKRKENNTLFSKDFSSSESSDNLKPNRNCEVNVKNRYYVDQNTLDEDKHQEVSVNDQNNSENDVVICDQVTGVRSRPKLGKLPSFIAFEEV